jgi:hypothetical protein
MNSSTFVIPHPPHGRTLIIGLKTAKGEYDASLEEDARHPFATGTVFQGLRADLNG